MQEHEVTFLVEAPRRRVWRALHPRWPEGPGPHVVDYPGGRIEVLFAGDEANQGLVRICTFPVPTFLLSGGKATSWECVVEARLHEYARYIAVGKPLWSRAEGWHRLSDEADGRTRLTFHETYDARNPVLRVLFEKRVHEFISARNNTAYSTMLGHLGAVERVG
jgi:hypothetical protein